MKKWLMMGLLGFTLGSAAGAAPAMFHDVEPQAAAQCCTGCDTRFTHCVTGCAGNGSCVYNCEVTWNRCQNICDISC